MRLSLAKAKQKHVQLLFYVNIAIAAISLESKHYSFKPAFRSKSVCSLIHKNKPLSYTRTRETVISRLKEICGDINLGHN